MEQALTHRSFTEGALESSNERMEFLGDAILGMVVTEYLYSRHPDWDQGQLSKAKASIVRESTLAEAARRSGIHDLLRLSPSEEAAGGRERPSILGDAFEAVVAAIFLDRGLEEARRFVIKHLNPDLDQLARGELPVHDYKSRLQEITQAKWRLAPSYQVVEEYGTPHRKTFVAEVRLEGEVLGIGSGQNKKQAEQSAAANALENLKRKQHRRCDEDATG